MDNKFFEEFDCFEFEKSSFKVDVELKKQSTMMLLTFNFNGVITVPCDRCLDAIDINGRVIDHLEISKTGERLNEEYLQTAIPRQAVGLHHALRSGLLPLSEEPQKGRAFTVEYEVSVPELSESVDVTFEFRSRPGSYELPEPKTIVIPKSGLTFSTEVKITPLVDIEVFMDDDELLLIGPPLWFDCSYQIGGIQAEFSRPVFLEFEED